MKLTRSEMYDALMLLANDHVKLVKNPASGCLKCAVRDACKKKLHGDPDCIELCDNQIIKGYLEGGKMLNKQKTALLK